MKVTLPKKEEAPKKEIEKKEEENVEETNELPEDEGTSEEGESLENITDEDADQTPRERKLALEKAKLEGRLEVLEEKSKLTPAQNAKQQQLNAIYSDLSMDDDDFKEKYKGYNKTQILQAVNNEQQAETSVKISRLEAKNSLSRKYKDFVEYEDQIEEALNDASPAVLQDPERLKKFMERNYQALSKDSKKNGDLPRLKPKLKEEPVKRIVKDFHAPTPKERKDDDSNENDEIKEEDRVLAAKFKIHSESQRKKYMSEFIPMDLGGGVTFVDPKKGFEKVGNTK